MINTVLNAEPETYGLFPRAKELLKLKRENKGGVYSEYCPWVHIYRLAAFKATTDEPNDLMRGSKITLHLLSNVPVDIAPYEVIATYGLLPYSHEELKAADEELKGYPWGGTTRSHIALDYRRLIGRGIEGVKSEIENRLALLDKASPDESIKRKIVFYESTKLSLDAVLHYAGRFREEALRLLSTETDADRTYELERLVNTLERVPLKPAGTFFEALQSIMLFYFTTRMLTGEPNSVGRLDYILHDYYMRDLERGLITPREACELLQVPRIKSSIMTGQSDSYILAGSNPDGTPFWNDLTYFILDATKGLKLQGPQIWFRYAPGQPRSLLRQAFQPLREGVTQPGFFNDAVAIPAMVRAGFTEEHARDYVCCQCVELSSQGRSNVLSGYCYNNLAKPIEILMNCGKEIVEDNTFMSWPYTDIPGHIPLEFGTFESFKSAYEAYLRHLLRGVVRRTNDILAANADISYALSSALLDGCVENGVFANEGGAVYNQTAPNFTGTITAADSLAAIRQYVYEEKKATLDELAQMCKDNFAGNEETRQYLLNRCPKYGNGDPSVDGLASWIFDIVDDELMKHKNIYGAAYMPQYFGWSFIDQQSYTLAATPDGRLHGETPSGTLGGDQGRERNGMTALFNSVTSLDHTRAPGGMNVNLRISRSLIAKDDDVGKMIDMLLAYFNNGGMEVQINCISREKLIDAQKHPEKYRDLAVRVTGQSLYFVELGIALQNQIINRVEHSL